jgi:hypothetical protein
MTSVVGMPTVYKYAKIEFLSSDNNSFKWESEKDLKSNPFEKENFYDEIDVKEKLNINDIEV